MKDFDEELKALEDVYRILAPLGVSAASRVWSHLSLRMAAEAVERERTAAEKAREEQPSEKRK